MLIDNSTPLYNLNTQSYPVYLRDVRLNHPNLSMPATPTDVQLLELGYVPVQLVTAPSGDVVTEGQPVQVDGRWVQTWETRAYTAEEIAAQLQTSQTELAAQVDRKRAIELSLPVPHVMTDGTIQHISMGATDQFILLQLRTEAAMLQAAGVTEPQLVWRSHENRTWPLTPAEVLELTGVALDRGRALYQASWVLKDQISAAQSVAELPTIPDTLVSL